MEICNRKWKVTSTRVVKITQVVYYSSSIREIEYSSALVMGQLRRLASKV